MKLYTLVENTTTHPELMAEHGLSLYIETGNTRILFDAGQSTAFAENARSMGVSLTDVDFVVLSHGHYDHGGGLLPFLEINKKAPVYIQKHAFQRFRNSKGKEIGLDSRLEHHPRVMLTEETLTLAPGITLVSCAHRTGKYPTDCDGMHICREDGIVRDDFCHEQYLLLEEKGKKILISGCSHRGILNIMDWFQPDVLIGGFHFMKQDPEGDMVTAAARKLAEYPTTYYTGHCTGQAQYEAMKEIMGARLEYLHTGRVLEL